jgi:hypothetical protein
MFDALQWMPKARRVDVLRTLTEAEQFAVDNPELALRNITEAEQHAADHPDTRTT